MLRFGDRLFYKDWWNSVNFSGYYRNWNIVVHDWLFTYIYQDTYMVQCGAINMFNILKLVLADEILKIICLSISCSKCVLVVLNFFEFAKPFNFSQLKNELFSNLNFIGNLFSRHL